MTFEPRAQKTSPGDAARFLAKQLARIRRSVRCAEAFLERALDHIDRAADDIAGGSAREFRGVHRDKGMSARFPLPVATRFVCATSTRVEFVVHGVGYPIDLSPARLDLLTLLSAPMGDSPDDLVGFKTPAGVVHALRARNWKATRRSITVEVSRLRTVLGPENGKLIETRRGSGYRFRLLRSGEYASPDA